MTFFTTIEKKIVMVIKLVNFVSNIGLEYGTVLGMHLPNSWNIKEDPGLNSPCKKRGSPKRK